MLPPTRRPSPTAEKRVRSWSWQGTPQERGRVRRWKRTARRRHPGPEDRPEAPETDCGPRTQIARNAIAANECRGQKTNEPTGRRLSSRHARPGVCGATAESAHVKGTSGCKDAVTRNLTMCAKRGWSRFRFTYGPVSGGPCCGRGSFSETSSRMDGQERSRARPEIRDGPWRAERVRSAV